MSKLDEILEAMPEHNTYSEHDIIKANIKALFNELVGEDTPRPRDCCDNEGGVICWKESKVKAANELRADLRKRIGEL